ncbi:MAG: DUF721 domain-containing protein [Thermoleophilia bacterium]|nr:DUF721 domain-containing protein [Thermoleophilia bacterium]
MSGQRGDGLPRPIGESVARELARAGGSPAAAALGELVSVWAAAVGEVVARNAWPARLGRDGVLVVHASSSTWAFELTHLEATIRDRLGAAAPRALRFVPGPLPEPPAAEAAGVIRGAPTPRSQDVSRAAELTAGIASEPLREAVAKAAAASLARAASAAGPAGPSDRLEAE